MSDRSSNRTEILGCVLNKSTVVVFNSKKCT